MCRGDPAAGDQRLQRIIEQLAKFAEVDFLTPEAEPVKLPGERRYWSVLRKLGVRIVNPLFMHRLPLLCRSRIRPYDWILIEFWYLADRLASSLEELRRELSYTGTSKIRRLQWESLNTKSRTEAALHEFSRESFDQIVKIIMDFPLGIMQPPVAWQ
jgi:hypothetical protein